MQIDSEESTISLHEPLFPPHIGLIGDDFMRSAISFELYGADFTSEDGEFFLICHIDFHDFNWTNGVVFNFR